MEHNLLQRLQHEPESRTQKSCFNAHNTSSSSNSNSSSSSSSSSNSNSNSNTASFFYFRRLSLGKLWLLSVLLIITITASSWPTGTLAAPRVARGAHLIWPHPNSSTEPSSVTAKAPSLASPAKAAHTHRRRLKLRRHHHVLERAAIQEASSANQEQQPPLVVENQEPSSLPSILYTNQTEGLKSCKAMATNAKVLLKLENALKAAQNFKDTVICTIEDWLYNSYNGTNIREQKELLKYHSMDLDHPLKHQVNRVTYSPEGKFEYKGPVGKFEEEMPKIVETLLVLDVLIKSTSFTKKEEDCTFRYLCEAVQYNTARAIEMMEDQKCNVPKEIHYHKGVVRLPFHVAMETIKVLTVLEYTYEKLLNA